MEDGDAVSRERGTAGLLGLREREKAAKREGELCKRKKKVRGNEKAV